MSTSSAPVPLTVLTDDEIMFRDAVAEFARGEVAPRVKAMERAGRIDPDLFPKYFELGLMGIEVEERFGGAGGSLMMVTLAVEEITKIDASAAIVCDVQNTFVNYPIARYGTEQQKTKYLGMLTSGTVGSYALSEAGSGSDAFGAGNPRREEGRPVHPQRPQALDHQRRRGRRVRDLRDGRPVRGIQGNHRIHRRARFPGFGVGKKEDKLGIRASIDRGASARQLRGAR